MTRSHWLPIVATIFAIALTQTAVFWFGVVAVLFLSIADWKAVPPMRAMPLIVVVQWALAGLLVWASKRTRAGNDEDVERNIALVIVLSSFPLTLLLDWFLFHQIYR